MTSACACGPGWGCCFAPGLLLVLDGGGLSFLVRGCFASLRSPWFWLCLLRLPGFVTGGSPGLYAAAPLAAGWLAPPGASAFFLLAGLLPCVGRLPRECSIRKIFRGFFWPAPWVGGVPVAVDSSFFQSSVFWLFCFSFAFRAPCSHLRRHHARSVCTAPGRGCVACAALSPLYLPVPLGPV